MYYCSASFYSRGSVPFSAVPQSSCLFRQSYSLFLLKCLSVSASFHSDSRVESASGRTVGQPHYGQPQLSFGLPPILAICVSVYSPDLSVPDVSCHSTLRQATEG